LAVEPDRAAWHHRSVLIDASDRRPPEPGPEPIDLDWRLWTWIVLAVLLFAAATSVTGAAGPGLALLGFTAALKALDRFVGRYGGGLQEWRQ